MQPCLLLKVDNFQWGSGLTILPITPIILGKKKRSECHWIGVRDNFHQKTPPSFMDKHAPVSGRDFPFPMLKRTNLHRKWRRWWSRALQTSAAPWRSASPPADEDQICVSYGDSMAINGDYIWRLMEINGDYIWNMIYLSIWKSNL